MGSGKYSMFGLRLFNKCMLNGKCNGITIVSKHPKNCSTWHWYLSIDKDIRPGFPIHKLKLFLEDKDWRRGQWHHYFHLWRGWKITLARQDYHKRKA